MLLSFPTLRTLALTALTTALTGSAALAQDSTLTRLIRQNQLSMLLQNRQFAGTGWDKLQQEVRGSQFVAVGEMHGTAQIPQLTAALAQVLQPKIFAVEISPSETQDLNRVVDQPAAHRAFQQQHPFALSFFSWSEEAALVRQLRAQQVQIMGIDQDNMFAAGRLYSRLAELSKSKATKTYLLRRAAAIQAHDRAVMGSQGEQITMMQQSAASLDSLVNLTRKESAQVQALVQGYVTSARIYQNNVKPATNAASHLERIGLMKRNLLLQLRPYQPTGTEALPKMLFKFGAEHCARGLSRAGVYDVGNMVVNLADMQTQKSLHILVLGKQGTTTHGFNPDDASKNTTSYSAESTSMYKLFFEQAAPQAWSVIDLRPLRRALVSRKLQLNSTALERIIQGYDYFLIIPETTANLVQ
ncbi:hypothetical protein [Hymenobacter cellulosilyticus]|uniref:Haem-binding uptake Tiki superfamily ChaN domain-containing protein n=1 Tax=Hymenobacter cellulosilyticus TaxID=2932248 RepID=A0A8T9Q0X3_9BACT|nr:hypothetical protein [Hymenobacter cellulosilyticus]UOQ70665.1 hypothetical protein MUN79_18410 [Hymenobacter cellulosilyticus]